MDKKDNIILAFESSCDETSVAVVKNGNENLVKHSCNSSG